VSIERIDKENADRIFNGGSFSGELRTTFLSAEIGDVFLIKFRHGEKNTQLRDRISGTCGRIGAVVSQRKHKDGRVVKFLGWRDGK
jgi:hypothetical protein